MPQIECNFTGLELKDFYIGSRVFYFDLKFILGKELTRVFIEEHYKRTYTLSEKILKFRQYRKATYRDKVLNLYFNKIISKQL